MKNIINLLLILILFNFSSCSTNEENDTEEKRSWLPKTTNYEDGTISAEYFYFDKNKLKEIKGYGSRYEFKYSGNNIVQLDSYPEPNWLELTEKFEYDSNGRVKKYTIIYYDVETWVEEYEYLSNTEVKVSHYAKRSPNDISYSTKILDSKGRLTRDLYSNGGTKIYEYDNKNSFEKNIQGLDKLSFVDGHYSGPYNSGVNNIIKVTHDKPNLYIENYRYEYNEENYPIKGYGNESDAIGYFNYY